jgi:hypothetical protein
METNKRDELRKRFANSRAYRFANSASTVAGGGATAESAVAGIEAKTEDGNMMPPPQPSTSKRQVREGAPQEYSDSEEKTPKNTVVLSLDV